MITLADVAKESHVSTMTVSIVLHHPEQVSDEVRQAVQQAISKLGYKPSRVGQALSQQRQFAIQFLILEDIQQVDPYYAKLLLYIADYLREQGYTFEISHDLTDHSSQVDGTFVSGARQQDLPLLTKSSDPIVSYGQLDQTIKYVDIDNFQGTYQMTHYLAKCGYQNLLYFGLDLNEAFAISREEGYLQAMTELNKMPTIFRIDNTEQAAANLIEQLIITDNSVIVAATDRIAIGALQQLLHLGIKIPADVGVTGFDGVFINQISLQHLTTVQQPLKKIAQSMVELLLGMIEKRPGKSTLIPPQLSIAQTTRALEEK